MERNWRLASGLTLFTYAACHFASYATGLLRLDVMEAIGRRILLAPSQDGAGHRGRERAAGDDRRAAAPGAGRAKRFATILAGGRNAK